MAVTLKSVRINNQISASYALTASYALNSGGGGGGGGSVPANTVSSSAQLSNGGGTAFTTSNNITVGSVTGSLLGTSSFANAFNPLPTKNNTYLVYQDGILKWVPIVASIVGFTAATYNPEYASNEGVLAVPLAMGFVASGWTSGSI